MTRICETAREMRITTKTPSSLGRKWLGIKQNPTRDTWTGWSWGMGVFSEDEDIVDRRRKEVPRAVTQQDILHSVNCQYVTAPPLGKLSNLNRNANIVSYWCEIEVLASFQCQLVWQVLRWPYVVWIDKHMNLLPKHKSLVTFQPDSAFNHFIIPPRP